MIMLVTNHAFCNGAMVCVSAPQTESHGFEPRCGCLRYALISFKRPPNNEEPPKQNYEKFGRNSCPANRMTFSYHFSQNQSSNNPTMSSAASMNLLPNTFGWTCARGERVLSIERLDGSRGSMEEHVKKHDSHFPFSLMTPIWAIWPPWVMVPSCFFWRPPYGWGGTVRKPPWAMVPSYYESHRYQPNNLDKNCSLWQRDCRRIRSI